MWPDDSQHVTSWLLANAGALSQAVGMDLDLAIAEERVGTVSVDLTGTDKATGDRVIVKTQLGVSDHTGLGQILTYAASTESAVVLWIAISFRDEHRTALSWLNDRTDGRTRFFAVQVDAASVGKAAPRFRVVVRPDRHPASAPDAATVRRWTEQDFLEALAGPDDAVVVAAAHRLDEHTRSSAPGAYIKWGVGKTTPSMSPQVSIGTLTLQPWTIYTSGAPGGGPLFAINFEYLHKYGSGVDDQILSAFAESLRGLPALRNAVDIAKAAGWAKRPSVPARALFADPGAVPTIAAAFAWLYQTLTTQLR